MKKILIIFLLSIISIPFLVSSVLAEGCKEGEKGCVQLENPLGDTTEAPQVVSLVIQGLLGIMGALVLLMFVWGGATWLLSAGNPEKVKAGSQTMIWAAIGAALVLLSYTMLSKILEVIGA